MVRSLRISAAIVLVFIVSNPFLFSQSKQFTLDDIFSGSKFSGKSVRDIRWMKDGFRFSFLDHDTVSKMEAIHFYSVSDGKISLAVNPADMAFEKKDPPFLFSSYLWSPDESQILFIAAPPQNKYLSRLTPAGNIFLFDIGSKKLKRLTDVAVPQYNVQFSPDGKNIAFVRLNNIYIIDLATKLEKQITFDGTDHIINGRFDWVYEEEFSISNGIRWSPDSKKIAFWRLDENGVPEYTMTEWDSLHLKFIPMRYPKPGDPNSIVSVGVAAIATGDIKWIDIGAEKDIYIPRIQWTKKQDQLSIQRLNRNQNHLELMLADVVSGAAATILEEKSEGWIDVRDSLTFLADGKFLWMSERDGFNHLYLISQDGKGIKKITEGNWEVDAFYGFDERSEFLYYLSTEISPTERHVFKIRIDGKKKEHLTKGPGYHSAKFSPSYKFYIDSYSNESTPTKQLLMKNDGSQLRILEDNPIPSLTGYALAKTELFTFQTRDSVMLNASLVKPANFDSAKKYAVIFSVYGGPGSQSVTRKWNGQSLYWHTYLAERGYLVCTIDNRGTGGRGTAFKFQAYKNLGKWEVNDNIEAAKYLATLSFVDKNRIGIWGWSYGGYNSVITILNGADYFRTAVAVAPVIDWKFYDDIYTERFMLTPAQNPDGYKKASALTYADKLKGNLLVIHGGSDDNVHFQNTATLISALQQKGKQFSMMLYPNRNHSIGGGKVRFQLYTMITNYFLEKL